jgi:hypothetical protein
LCIEWFLWGEGYLGCQKLLKTGSFYLLDLKKFHPKLEFHDPPNCGGSNGDSKSLSRNPEVNSEESAAPYRKIAYDFAATHPEVIYDPYPGLVAFERSREFDLIANVLPLFRHIGALKMHSFEEWSLR